MKSEGNEGIKEGKNDERVNFFFKAKMWLFWKTS